MRRTLAAVYRVRVPLYAAAMVLLVVSVVLTVSVPPSPVRPVLQAATVTALVGMVASAALSISGVGLAPVCDPVRIQAPVRGRWQALNSPATTVPSHGVRAYGQAYAIDLVHEPLDRPRPTFGDGPAMRASEDYPAFGEPVTAVLDGVVVRAADGRRDHRARSNLAGFIYLMLEGPIREFGGPGAVIGNHVTIAGADGVFATIAHLRRGSVAVRVGDRVEAGDRIGFCGNSGNSSEPHVHAQLMDRASPWTGQGIPFVFADVVLGDDPRPVDGVPETAQHMSAAVSVGD